jgi:hypothetical protein
LLFFYTCHSANESDNHHIFTRKRSVSSISMTPRRKNLPEECIKKEHVTGLQWSVRIRGLQPKDFGINNEVGTSKSHEGIMNKSIYMSLRESRYLNGY